MNLEMWMCIIPLIGFEGGLSIANTRNSNKVPRHVETDMHFLKERSMFGRCYHSILHIVIESFIIHADAERYKHSKEKGR